MNTIEMVEKITKNPDRRFKATLDGNEIIAFVNQNGGISIGRQTLVLSGEIIKAEWELVNKRYTFIEAINSGKKIKHENWKDFKTIQEALYDLLDYTISNTVKLINGHWNIEDKEL